MKRNLNKSGLKSWGLLLAVTIAVAIGPWIAAGAALSTVQRESGVIPLATGGQTQAVAAELPAAKEEHGLSQAAVPVLNKLGWFPITNSMLVSWVVALGLIVFAQVATRRM